MINDISKIEIVLKSKEHDVKNFKINENGVKEILLEENAKLIRIKFEKNNEWDQEIIPLSSIKFMRIN